MGSIKPTKTKRGYFGKVESSLNEKLEKVEWGEYRFSEIFNKISQGRRLKKDDHISGDIPFVMAGVTNTGVVNYISNPVSRFPSNSITIDIFGNVFYRDYDFGAGDDTGVYWSTEKEYSKSSMLFFSISMSKSLEGRFDYGNKLRSSKSLNFKFNLPVKNEKIDFEFMESFIAELEAARIAELEAYLEVTGLSDCELTEDEQKALDDYDELHFKSFKIEELLDWQKGISEINPLHLDSLAASDNERYPFYGQSTVNCGVIKYVDLDKKVLNNENSRPTILIHSNNQNIVFLETPFYLKDGHGATSVLNSNELTKNNALFFMSSIRKVIAKKFTYNNKATKIALKSTYVDVPINKLDSIDYSTMELLISAIQKIVIKDVVEYTDTKIQAHKEVIHS
ncbi:restriction endonuclease [Vibrio tasmaniensis]|uniref:restriction endonuclease subunit S n=1 Tax=Vibrio TaxID=662 RepID=UPI000C866C6B|nr:MULTISPECIES: restriction endonuclease subunit S [Vibrio]PMO86638.1 restriction endonuclease [Vibrio tasmaniensis]PTO84628.1 restriction endonuclease [Vibrio splendidus]